MLIFIILLNNNFVCRNFFLVSNCNLFQKFLLHRRKILSILSGLLICKFRQSLFAFDKFSLGGLQALHQFFGTFRLRYTLLLDCFLENQ